MIDVKEEEDGIEEEKSDGSGETETEIIREESSAPKQHTALKH